MDNNYGQYGGQKEPMPDVQPTPPPYYFPPDYVSPEEKKKIRKNYNSIGITLLANYILGNVFVYAAVFIMVIAFGFETAHNESGEMIVGTAEMIISSWLPAITAAIVFVGYCIFTKYDPKELFSTERLQAGEIFKYVLLVLFFQRVSIIISMFISSFLYSLGFEVTAFDYVMSHDPQTYAADFIAVVILAPIAEELIYRGVVLRCAAKVSGRFGIFFSAFMFGLMHGNPYQCVLGFLIGIVLAMITLKTGSIIPSIICHMANNLVASATTVIEYFDEALADTLNILSIPLFFIIGIIVLLNMGLKGEIKFPPYTERHKKRTLPIMITSWSMILVTIFFIIETIQSIGPVTEPIEEAVRILIKQ